VLALRSPAPSSLAGSRTTRAASRTRSTLSSFLELLTDSRTSTVGDYTAQALVSALLAAHFPSDAIIGEEDSADLQRPEQATVKAQIVRLAGEAMREALPLADEERAWDQVKRVERGDNEWMAAIDRGNSEGGAKGRHWALDPIDGTKGFLRGGQYAVCLGLIEDGEVVLGVMGCPNLPVDPKQPEGDKGALFVAVKGQGAFQVRRRRRSLALGRARGASKSSRLVASYRAPTDAPLPSPAALLHLALAHPHHDEPAPLALGRVVLRVGRGGPQRPRHERAHRPAARHHARQRAHGQPGKVLLDREGRRRHLLAPARQRDVRGEGLVRPGPVPLPRSLLFLALSPLPLHRLSSPPRTAPLTPPLSLALARRDHSSGSLLVAEAGGIVSDMHGKPLDFSLGRTLKGNKGVIAAPKEWHTQVIEAVAKAVGEEGK